MLDAKKLRLILLLLSHVHVGPSDLFPSSFKLKILCTLISPCMLYVLSPHTHCFSDHNVTL